MRSVKLPIALAVIFAAVILSVPLSASRESAAVRINAEEIAPGDLILIVNDAAENTLSVFPSGRRLAPTPIDVRNGAVDVIPDGAAVFEAGKNGDGYLTFLSSDGYLTSSETGNGLSYSKELTECGLWEAEDGCYLRSAGAEYNGQRDEYLEYYPNSDFYSTYGRSSSPDAYFRMSFFRLTGKQETQTSGIYRLPLFETSDVHGYLADISSDEYQYRMAYISDKVKDVRGYGEGYDAKKAILVDGGDLYQGNTLSNLLEGMPIFAAYEIMDYDAVTVGNHEFDWGIENTTDTDATMPDYTVGGETFENNVPLVVSNMYKDGEKVGFAKDYVILEKTAEDADGNAVSVRVAVIGFASDYASSIMHSKFTGAGYSVREDYQIAERLASELEKNGECDATVLLTHGEASYAAGKLSRGTAIDLVLGGHTHTNLCGRTADGVQYIQPASYGAAYAYCELTFRADGNGVSFTGVSSARTVRTADEPSGLFNNEKNADDLDRDIVLLTDMFAADITDALNERIGYITVNAGRYDYISGSGERSSTMGNWLASIEARAVGADVGFINSGGIRTDMPLRVYDGRRYITAADVYAMFPFDNRIFCYEVTYKELLGALEYSLTSSGSTLLSRMTGIVCYYTGSGISALVKDGVTVYCNGAWADGVEDKKIKVAVNEYIATSDRPEGNMSNPFYVWRETDRLVYSETVDSDGALTVLRDEAEKNGGLLAVDHEAYYRRGVYSNTSASGSGWSLANGALSVRDGADLSAAPWKIYAVEITALDIGAVFDTIPSGAFDGCVNVERVMFSGTREQWYAMKIEDSVLTHGQFRIECSDGAVKAVSYLCGTEGHVMRSVTVLNPTPEKDGVIQHYCERCGYEEYENVPYEEEKTEEKKDGPSYLIWAVPAAAAAAAAVPVTVAVRKRSRNR